VNRGNIWTITSCLRIVCISLSFLLAVGCVSIPKENLLISRREEIYRTHPATPCDPAKPISTLSTSKVSSAALNASGISVMVWNMMKGAKEGWQADFKGLMENNDILVIQEAYLIEELRKLLQAKGFVWDMVLAFELNGISAGVLTASNVKPDFLCTLKTEEPLLKIPKTTLITLYPIAGTNHTLMVVNLHLVNFTPGLSGFQNQLTRIDQIVSKHTGPLILAGDFNTWSDQRLDIVREHIDRLGLKPVVFEKDNRREFFGHFVDHVYYRDLKSQDARVIRVNSSDHNPMVVYFKLHD